VGPSSRSMSHYASASPAWLSSELGHGLRDLCENERARVLITRSPVPQSYTCSLGHLPLLAAPMGLAEPAALQSACALESLHDATGSRSELVSARRSVGAYPLEPVRRR
jgi:hypothetical protein